MTASNKVNRIYLFLKESDKAIINKAAQYRGVTLSDYFISAALKQTELGLKSDETIALVNKDRDALLKSLGDSPEPNPALKVLFSK